MFSQYEPNVRATIYFLKLLKIKVTDTTVNYTLMNHPDWPSLLCISDSLHAWNIPNGAGKIHADDIDILPVPFMAHTKSHEFPLAIVTGTDDKQVKFLCKNFRKEEVLQKDAFAKIWGGVFLFAEPDEHSGEKGYDRNRKRELEQSSVFISTFCALLLLYCYALLKNLTWSHHLSVNIFLQYLISAADVFVTSLLLWYEVDKSNPFLQKVCTGIRKGNCDAILSSPKAKAFKSLTWSEVGFFFFAGAFFTLAFSGMNIPGAFILIGWLNVLPLPYVFFSVYYQWKVAKQWCILCLIVQFLLVSEAVNTLAHPEYLLNLPAVTMALPAGIVACLLPIFFWFLTKPLLLKLKHAKNVYREYLRIKFDTDVFTALLQKQKKVVMPAGGIGIDTGNPSATNVILKVCNPYCGPCSDAHPKIEKLLVSNSNLKVKILFKAYNADSDSIFEPVSRFLAIAESKPNDEIKNALNDWHLSKEKNHENFAMKYPVNDEELQRQKYKIDTMIKWCREMDIHVTPTYFFNGYKLPNHYRIEDLQYFLSE